MFNTKESFRIQILSGGTKECIVTYPTDQQWFELTRKKRSIRRKGGRGALGWDELGNHRQLDLELLTAIAVDASAEGFDEYEASKAIDRLAKADTVDVVRDGDQFRVELDVFGRALVTHVLRMPTERQMVEYERASSAVKETAKGTVLEILLKPSAELWDELAVESTGYADGSEIPAVHKSNAVTAAIRHQQEMESLDPQS